MTTRNDLAASFAPNDSATSLGPQGQRAHRQAIEQAGRIAERFEEIREGVWSFVGNGLSNQTFVQGPLGVIAIDTGESIQEMQCAIDRLREKTDAPIVAVIYTHFH